MTKIAYFDCFSGISGNMTLGALLACGVDIEYLRTQLSRLPLQGYAILAENAVQHGLSGLHVSVNLEKGEQPRRHLKDIERIFAESDLSSFVKENSHKVFRRLAEAEAKVHGEPVEHVHFHEVGAVDAIVDVAGSMICLEALGVEEVVASALPNGHGTIHSAHGILPIPAPATAELLIGIPQFDRDVEAELVTPTGAAILASLATKFGTFPEMKVEAVGYGAGSKQLPWANFLRVFVGVAESPSAERDTVLVVETNIDDMNPELFEHAMDLLLAGGALDVYLVPIQMKRNRPAVLLGVLVEEPKLDDMLGILFAETTTIGVRIHPVQRRKLVRESATVTTEYGEIRVKLARDGMRIRNIAPEYRDCLRIAKERSLPLKDVYAAAQRASAELLDERHP